MVSADSSVNWKRLDLGVGRVVVLPGVMACAVYNKLYVVNTVELGVFDLVPVTQD